MSADEIQATFAPAIPMNHKRPTPRTVYRLKSRRSDHIVSGHIFHELPLPTTAATGSVLCVPSHSGLLPDCLQAQK
jgi:hypothetical protein